MMIVIFDNYNNGDSVCDKIVKRVLRDRVGKIQGKTETKTALNLWRILWNKEFMLDLITLSE